MKIQEKPDYLIFADSAKNGECTNFPDVSRGWGVTIDQTGAKPPLEWMNGAFNRIDKNMLYLLQQGVPEWSETVIYPVNAIIKYNGVLYTATVKNDNAIPATSNKWKKTQAEMPTSSTVQKGIVKLSSATNSLSETEAATPLAVKIVNEKTEDAHHRISQVHDFSIDVNNRVNAISNTFLHDEFESRVRSPNHNIHLSVRNDGTVALYSYIKNNVSWYINHDGWFDGFVDVSRIGRLEQFIKDRVLPVGIPQPWPSDHLPAGWLECNGSPFDVNQFPKLASVYPWGTLPDLRGLFIRGKDNGRGLDPNRGILSYQDDAIRNIYGEMGFYEMSRSITTSGAFHISSDPYAPTTFRIRGDGSNPVVRFDASRTVPTANENRPRNIAFIYIVKAE